MRWIAVAAAAAIMLLPGLAAAQIYPDRPIRLLVSSAAGGTVDVIARVIAQKLSLSLGQPVIADNRAGAAGTVSAEIAAQAAPDGYTLLVVSSPPMASNVTLRAGKMTYNPEQDFTYITLTGKVPLALSVLPSFPAKTLKEFVAYAKSRPGKINYGSAGTGSTNHLVGELLKIETGIDITHIPFKGGAPAMAALLGNQLEMYIATLPTIMPMVRAGRIRAIAVSSARRSAAMPDIPTIAESGLPGFDVTAWYCVVGPAGIPKTIATRLNAEIVKILNSPESRERLTELGVNVETTTPEELKAFIHSEIQKLGNAIRRSGTKIE